MIAFSIYSFIYFFSAFPLYVHWAGWTFGEERERICASASSCWPVVSPPLFFSRAAFGPFSRLSLSLFPILPASWREGGRRGCDPIELSAISHPSPEPKSGATYDVFPEVEEKENEKKVSPFLSFSFFLSYLKGGKTSVPLSMATLSRCPPPETAGVCGDRRWSPWYLDK